MQRVAVTGISGSGKTRLARRLAAAMDAPYLELDAVFHQPGWQERPLEEFRADVDAHTSHERWVVDGSYQSRVGDLTWGRADTVVWVDPPRWRGMARIVRRTLHRVVGQQELWNGNRETWANLMPWNPPTDNIIRWAWTRYGPMRERMEAAMADPEWEHVTFLRVRRDADVDALLARAASARRDA